MKYLKVPGSMLMLQKFKPPQDQKKNVFYSSLYSWHVVSFQWVLNEWIKKTGISVVLNAADGGCPSVN